MSHKHIWGISHRYNAKHWMETCSICKTQRRVLVIGAQKRRYTYLKTGKIVNRDVHASNSLP